jgi:hypothetical protein
MLGVLDSIEAQLRDQYLKQNESLKKIADLQKIEEKENLIIERLDRLEQVQLNFLTQMNGGAAPGGKAQAVGIRMSQVYQQLITSPTNIVQGTIIS